jgi:hypothetical protein
MKEYTGKERGEVKETNDIIYIKFFDFQLDYLEHVLNLQRGFVTHQIKEGEYAGDEGKKILEEELEVINNLIKTITTREEVEKS